MTEEPAQDWEQMRPQAAAYPQDMTAQQYEPRYGRQGEQPVPQSQASPQTSARGQLKSLQQQYGGQE